MTRRMRCILAWVGEHGDVLAILLLWGLLAYALVMLGCGCAAGEPMGAGGAGKVGGCVSVGLI